MGKPSSSNGIAVTELERRISETAPRKASENPTLLKPQKLTSGAEARIHLEGTKRHG